MISRLQGDYSDIKKASVKTAMEQEIAAVMPKDAASSYNQGLIEIGALVCIPGGEPKCRECPLESLCITKKKGLWKEIPVKSVPSLKEWKKKRSFSRMEGESSYPQTAVEGPSWLPFMNFPI